MGLIDGLVALAVLFSFGYIILSQIRRKNPELSERINQFFSLKMFEKAISKDLGNSELVKEQVFRQKVDRM